MLLIATYGIACIAFCGGIGYVTEKQYKYSQSIIDGKINKKSN